MACGEQPPPAAEEPPVAAPVVKSGEPAEPETPDIAVDEEFINHMHVHAEQMDELMFALSDGDLDGAMTPAYWLSRHRTVSTEVPEDWQQHIQGMREAALAVEASTDLESARAAAERISIHCQGCHSAAGVVAP